MTGLEREVALGLFNLGAIKFGSFRLKMHEAHPDAPESPIYLNLRTADNPKPGPLTAEIFQRIGALMCLVVSSHKGMCYDAIAGIPNAGDTFADAMGWFAATMRSPAPRVIRMTKIADADGKRRIADVATVLEDSEQLILLVDDLITAADTKVEAVRAIHDAGREVEAVVVLVDREQGGPEVLRDEGVDFYAVFTLTDLLDLYVDEKLIEASVRDEVQSYKRRVEEYMASVAS